MRKLLIFLFAMPLAAQTINPNQIKPSTHNGYVLTTQTGATVWAPATGGAGYAVKHNGTLLTGDFAAFTDFDDSTPTPPPNTVNVTFQTNVGTGKLSAYVPIPSTLPIRVELIPPVAGQYVVLYPNAVTTSYAGNCTAAAPVPAPTASLTSAILYLAPQVSGFPPSNCSATWTFNGALAAEYPSLPSGNVTAVYAGASSSYYRPPGIATLAVSPGATFFQPALDPPWDLQQSTSALTSITGATIDTAAIQALLSRSGTTSQTVTIFTVNSPVLFVYYSGSPQTTTAALNIAAPLTLSTDVYGNQVLGVDPNFPTHAAPLNFARHIAELGPATGNTGFLIVSLDGCSGSSTPDICLSDGVTYNPIGGGGGSGLSGMTTGQVPIAATASTVTSSKVLAGAGAGITTGPTSSTTGHCAQFTGSGGQIADSGAACSSGGTTTNALTVDNGGSGDASGFTFDGSAAKTLSYNSIGAAPTASPTFTGTPDASGATQFKLPVAAGATTAANGEFKYDTTNKNWHSWGNGVDNFLALFPVASPPTNGDCVQFALSGGVWTLSDAGAGCGGAGGPPTGAAGGVLGGTYPNPAFATIAADAVLQNATGGTAAPTAVAMPTCTAGADLYNTSTHTWSCVSTSIGALPTATQPGQIIASTAAGTTYAIQGQVFYSVSGDTITTIEMECSSVCTYVSTIPQTMTIGASHAMNSNVHLLFLAGGKWTVNGAFTLSNIQINESSALTQHWAGTSTLSFATNVSRAPVEWFGAVGDWNGSTGTDNTTPINNCISTMSSGQCVLQAKGYKTTAAITITKPNVGIAGTVIGNTAVPYAGTDNPSYIITTSASATIIDLAGVLGTYLNANRFTDFSIGRTLAPTGTATGFSCQYTAGAVVERVVSQDSIRGFYIKGCPTAWNGGFFHSNAIWGYNGISIGSGVTVYGWYLDTSVAPNSTLFRDDAANDNTAATSYGWFSTAGQPATDVNVEDFGTSATDYGIYVSLGGQDAHFTNITIDACKNTGIFYSGASVMSEFAHGWINCQGSPVDGARFSSATGVIMDDFQILGSFSSAAINLQSVGQYTISNNIITKQNTGGAAIKVNVGSGTLANNQMLIQNSTTCMAFTSANSNNLNGNLCAIGGTGTSTVGVSFDASSSSNNSADANTFIGIATPVSDATPTNGNRMVTRVSPLTTKGDLWTFSTVNTRLPVGANGTVLTADSTQASGVKWASTGTATVVCSGSQALGTSAIGSGAAATTVTVTCTGLLTTDNISLDFNADPTATTGYIPSASGMLTIIKWPTANTINISVVNNTAGSITPGAVTVNYRVVR